MSTDEKEARSLQDVSATFYCLGGFICIAVHEKADLLMLLTKTWSFVVFSSFFPVFSSNKSTLRAQITWLYISTLYKWVVNILLYAYFMSRLRSLLAPEMSYIGAHFHFLFTTRGYKFALSDGLSSCFIIYGAQWNVKWCVLLRYVGESAEIRSYVELLRQAFNNDAASVAARGPGRRRWCVYAKVNSSAKSLVRHNAMSVDNDDCKADWKKKIPVVKLYQR